MRKRMLCALTALFLLIPCVSLAESLPPEGAAPYAPVESALSGDGMSYDDGTMSVKITTDVVQETKIYWVEVKISDPSQLRTAVAGAKGTKAAAQPLTMAKRNNAVLAINGDFYAGHNSGVVYRMGELLRNVPVYSRDELMIDANGDLTILDVKPGTSSGKIAEGIEAYMAEHEIRHAFCFGPGLIKDGERLEFDYREKVSCGYPTRAQRMIIAQTGELQYLFLATEGPEQDEPGLTVPECVDLLMERGDVITAYNLDGGNSTHIILCGEKINAKEFPKSRDIADIIYFATLVPSEGTAEEP